MSLNILFRADSSSKIGLGHIMRDLVLASQYKNANIYFATKNLDGNINQKIIDSGYKVINIDSDDEVFSIIRNLEIDLVIFDHYKITYKFEKKVKQKTDVKILSFDDTYEKHHCDILLNHNISADKKRYKNLVPKNCKIRCGSKYTLIRDEFKKVKVCKPKQKTIFLAMGGADTENISLKILKTVPKKYKVNLVTTSSNSNLPKLKEYITKHRNITLFINTDKIAEIMANSTLAIVTPSVILHEVLYLKIPFIAIQTANNQKDMRKYLDKNGYIVLKKFDKKRLEDIIWKR